MQETPTLGRRERKKRETRRALALSARELVVERGLDEVTVEDVAAAADVSVRTFFNHFASKDEALVGVEPTALAELADELRQRPAAEGPAEALRAFLLDQLRDEPSARRWQLRNELVRRYPALLPRHLAATVEVEEALAGALADRSGTDVDTDPFPRALTAAALAVVRSGLTWWWERADRGVDVTDVVAGLLDQLLPTDPTAPTDRPFRGR